LAEPQRQRLIFLAAYTLVLVLVFGQTLSSLMSYALRDELNSQIPLIPPIVAYLLYSRRYRDDLPYQTSVGAAIAVAIVAGIALSLGVTARGLNAEDALALKTASFVFLVIAGGFLFLGSRTLNELAFPLSFLLFMIPVPERWSSAVESSLVEASADVAAALLRATGTPLVREQTIFSIPGIVLEVARECSGIRSSWALFITSVLASNLLLKSPWRRVLLVAFVIPLGVVRNGFRILVIALLCVYFGPEMIDSPVHHQGGPLFFVLSLGPLLLMLWWLRRGEQ